jgi:tRNA/tmRNA/rRNA uracil-C5-methylase (TrmA/RlmC/RlmD family)
MIDIPFYMVQIDHLIVATVKIIRYGVDHILYISCKPTSLVRDLEVFLERGYQVERAVAVDQFPWTANCETVALLSKVK